MATDKLGLPDAGGVSSHFAVNEALFIIDVAHACRPVNLTTAAPPVSPTNGDTYIIAAAATGDWAGLEGYVTAWFDEESRWVSFEPWLGFVFFPLSDLTQGYVMITWSGATYTYKNWTIA